MIRKLILTALVVGGLSALGACENPDQEIGDREAPLFLDPVAAAGEVTESTTDSDEGLGTTCPPGVDPVLCFVSPCAIASCPSHPEAVCTNDYCGGCYAVWTDANGAVVDCDEELVCSLPGRDCPQLIFPIYNKDGFCAPYQDGCKVSDDNTCIANLIPAVDCRDENPDTYDYCVDNTCQNTTCPLGVDEVQCLVSPCAIASCPAHPEAVCTNDYCGGCTAVWTDADGAVVDCNEAPACPPCFEGWACVAGQCTRPDDAITEAWVHPDVLDAGAVISVGEVELVTAYKSVVIYANLCAGWNCSTSAWYVVVAQNDGEGGLTRELIGTQRPRINGSRVSLKRHKVQFPITVKQKDLQMTVNIKEDLVDTSDSVTLGGEAVEIDSLSALFYIDYRPTWRFVHPTALVLVGEQSTLTPAVWYPILNGQTLSTTSRKVLFPLRF